MNESVTEAPLSSTDAGLRLTSAREKLGLSVQDVAHYLNLTPDIIRALEQGEYAQLPGKTFAHGYLRAYAKLLKLDDQAFVVADFVADQPKEILYGKVPLKRVVHRSHPHKRRGIFYGVVIAAVLIGLAAVTQLSNRGDFGVKKFLDAFGLSPQASHAESAIGTSVATHNGALLDDTQNSQHLPNQTQTQAR